MGLRQNPVPYLSTEGYFHINLSWSDTHTQKRHFLCDYFLELAREEDSTRSTA